MSRARTWCFTLNNPSFATSDLPHCDNERYVVWQREVAPGTGTVHLQGYIELSAPTRLGALKRWLPTAHFEPRARHSSREAARNYCMKEDSRDEGDDAGPHERGSFEEGGQGKRRDLDEAVDALREGGIRAVVEQHATAFVKYHRGLYELQRQLEVKPRDMDFEPRPWQQDVLDYLTGEPDDRHILWVTDGVGNNGKSRLARHLILEHGAVQLEGRVQDMAYMYNKERVVVIDVSRAQLDNVKHLYSFAEKLKNGVVVCTKYECHQKLFDPPHVIFFSNQTWEREFWSEDRVIEINLVTDY